jgi:hypothetical protein
LRRIDSLSRIAFGGNRRIGQLLNRGLIIGFVPIPNGDLATTNFALGGPNDRYLYGGGGQRHLLALQDAYRGLVGPGGVRLKPQP